MRLLDVRHEQTAAFAAEATGKLTRVPGLAVLTAGPGVTNGVSAIAQAQFAGSPMVVVGGRAPPTGGAAAASRSSTSRRSSRRCPSTRAPCTPPATCSTASTRPSRPPRSAHRGPAFVDVPMDEFFNSASGPAPTGPAHRPARARPRRDRRPSPGCSARPSRPVLILGTDVWADGAEEAALRLVEALGLPTITNGMGRGLVPGGHPLLVTKARGQALGASDLVVVVGTPLDFRLGYGVFGGKEEGSTPARVVHLADSPGQVSGARGARRLGVRGPDHGPRRAARRRRPAGHAARLGRLGRGPPGRPSKAAAERDAALLGAEADPIHPARIYGELVPRLADDAVVIGDGGDFVSFAGKFVEPQAARWLARPRPLRLPRRGPGRRHRRPARPAVGAGDPAAGRRRRGLLADGRRHPGPPRPAGRDGDGQQRGLGPGEGPDADALRLRRRRRPLPRHVLRRRRARARRRRRDRRPTRARSARPSTGPTPPASPTWSTWSPTWRRPTRAPRSASDGDPARGARGVRRGR